MKLCKTPVCGTLDFGITAQVSGNHQMKVYFQGLMQIINQTFSIGEEIEFDVSNLNEHYEFIAQLFDPFGTQVIIQKDGVEYDCFEFQTVLSISLTEQSTES